MGEAVESPLMRRALSFLMMMVMVIAPCALAHAATVSSHHTAVSQASDTGAAGHKHAMPSDGHANHAGCADETGHAECSGDCDTLQRVSNFSTTERVSADAAVVYDAITAVLGCMHVATAGRDAPAMAFDDFQPNSDSKSVLRKTARLRL